MKRQWVAALVALVASAVQAHEPVRGDVERGRQIADSQSCPACHGPRANSENPRWPKLAGLDANYLYQQLVHFQAGTRSDPFMTPQAQDLSEQDMQDLAVYFASQPVQTDPVDVVADAQDEELVKLRQAGARIYRSGLPERGMVACMACHGADGGGLPMAGIPQIGGQNAPYLVGELQDFRSGKRATDRNAVMRDVASELSDAQIRAVSAYVSSLIPGQTTPDAPD